MKNGRLLPARLSYWLLPPADPALSRPCKFRHWRLLAAFAVVRAGVASNQQHPLSPKEKACIP